MLNKEKLGEYILPGIVGVILATFLTISSVPLHTNFLEEGQWVYHMFIGAILSGILSKNFIKALSSGTFVYFLTPILLSLLSPKLPNQSLINLLTYLTFFLGVFGLLIIGASFLSYFTKWFILTTVRFYTNRSITINIPSITGFGNEMKSWRNLLSFLRSPVVHMENDKEDESSALFYMTFIIRLSIILGALVMTPNLLPLGVANVLGLYITAFMNIIIVFLVAKAAMWVGSLILRWMTKMLYEKETILESKRVVSYSSTAILLFPIPLIGPPLSVFISSIIIIIGVSKQMKLGYGKAFLVSFPLILLIFISFALSFVA